MDPSSPLLGYVGGGAMLPRSRVDVLALQQRLTYRKRKTRYDKETPAPIHGYSDQGDYIRVPVFYAYEHYPDLLVEDRTFGGVPYVIDQRANPAHPSAPPGQGDFISACVEYARTNYTGLMVAGTGTGKTVVAASVTAELGRSTLVLVNMEKSLIQWQETFRDVFGVPEEDIGIVRGAKQQLDRPIVIATYQTAIKRDVGLFQRRFGIIHFDEAHRVAAPTLARTALMFDAGTQLAWTATPYRRDGMFEIVTDHFGPPAMEFLVPPEPVNYRVIPYNASRPPWGSDTRSRVRALTLSQSRNRWLASLVHELYASGRVVLAPSVSVAHIEEIGRILVEERQVPAEDIGYYAASHPSDTAKSGREKTTRAYLDWVEEVPPIILATQGAVKEAVDIPRINSGVELTPPSVTMQLLGRARRRTPGKPLVEWYSPLDTNMAGGRDLLAARIRELSSDPSVEIIHAS